MHPLLLLSSPRANSPESIAPCVLWLPWNTREHPAALPGQLSTVLPYLPRLPTATTSSRPARPPHADLMRALQRAPGGLLLVPTDDSLLQLLNTTAPGDWLADSTFLRQLLARHTILAASQPVRGPDACLAWLGVRVEGAV